MLRWIRIPLGLVLILSVTGGTARAQYGWGWGGWGGWGETPQGSIARGSALSMPAQDCPEDGRRPFDQRGYMAAMESVLVPLERRGHAEVPRQEKLRHPEQQERLQFDHQAAAGNPTAKDLDDGDALNAALDQLTDPRIQSSSLKDASDRYPQKSSLRFRFDTHPKPSPSS